MSAESEEASINFFPTGTQFTNLKLLCNNLVVWKGDHQTTETKESSSTEEMHIGRSQTNTTFKTVQFLLICKGHFLPDQFKELCGCCKVSGKLTMASTRHASWMDSACTLQTVAADQHLLQLPATYMLYTCVLDREMYPHPAECFLLPFFACWDC